MRASGGLIAGISLIVGGIGITNIMLASITKQIRELGAVIGVIGGLLGLLAGLGVLLVAISLAENAPVLELNNVLISFSFAVMIGVISGLYPALSRSEMFAARLLIVRSPSSGVRSRERGGRTRLQKDKNQGRE